MSFQAADLVVESDEESSGHCDCCGQVTRCIWGYIAKNDACVAAYYVRWTVDRFDHDPAFELVLGPWGEATTPDDRYCVSLRYRAGTGFMVIDADRERFVSDKTASAWLRRDQVIGTPLAPQVFAMIDAIWLQDRRLFSAAATKREEEN